jgi:hypothetical protein
MLNLSWKKKHDGGNKCICDIGCTRTLLVLERTSADDVSGCFPQAKMTRTFSHLADFLIVLLSQWTIAVVLATNSTTTTEIDFGLLVKWVNAQANGYVNPKLEIRRLSSEDETESSLGIFAKERVEGGDVIAHIPWSIIIIGTDEDDDDDFPDGNLDCRTVRNLAKELKLGDKSKYAPYVRHLLSLRDGQIPSGWSDAGKFLVLEILGGEHQELPPGSVVSMLENEWFKACKGEENDIISTKAAELVMQRDDNDLMVPLYDLIEHRNGDYTNTKTQVKESKYHKTLASRDIEAGEQIYKSHDLCEDCNEDSIEQGYGTAGMYLCMYV